MTRLEELTETGIEQIRNRLIQKTPMMTSERATKNSGEWMERAKEMVLDTKELKTFSSEERLKHAATFFTTIGVSQEIAESLVKELLVE